jgi:succinoglycan biosynthesis transport protein ExoP
VSDYSSSPTPFDSSISPAPPQRPTPDLPTPPRRTLDLSRHDGHEPLGVWREEEEVYSSGALRQAWAMLLRRRKVILATLGTVVLATMAFLLLKPSVYESVATLQVHTTPVVSGDSDDSDLPVLADLSGATQSRSLETQLEILRSDAIRQRALARLSPGARAEAQKYFDTTIEAVGDTDLISITSRTYNNYASAAVSNAFCNAYIQLSREKNRGQLEDATSYLNRQRLAAQTRLVQARNALRAYKQRYGTFDLPAQTQNLLEELGQIEGEWREARANKASALAELNKLRSVAAGLPETRVVPQEIVRRPAVEAMKTQLTRLELDRLAALEEYQPDRPEVQAIEGQIRAIRQRLQQEAQTEVGSWTREVNPVRQNLSQDIAKLQGQVWAAEARGVALKASSIRARAQLAQLPEREQRMGQLTSNLNSQQQTYQMLNEKFQNLRMTQEARVANAAVLFPAQPGELESSSKARNLIFAVLLGLVLAIGLAALLDWLDDRVYSEQDAKVVSRLPVLAQIPYLENQAHQSLLQSTFDEQSPSTLGPGAPPNNHAVIQALPDNPALLESFRMARTSLALASNKRPISSVLITSSLPHEGKSLTSMNLAIAAALSGERVILVDCDLRRPSIHSLLQLPNQTGLSSVVQGSSSLSQALQDTKVPNLRVLTSGPLVNNSFQLLNSPAARAALQQVMEQADFVVVDSPPALILADAQILSTMTDATLLVISSQDAGRREIVRTRELLSHNGNRPVGVILNKVNPEVTGSYDQYSYYGPNSSRNHLSRRFV